MTEIEEERAVFLEQLLALRVLTDFHLSSYKKDYLLPSKTYLTIGWTIDGKRHAVNVEGEWLMPVVNEAYTQYRRITDDARGSNSNSEEDKQTLSPFRQSSTGEQLPLSNSEPTEEESERAARQDAAHQPNADTLHY